MVLHKLTWAHNATNFSLKTNWAFRSDSRVCLKNNQLRMIKFLALVSWRTMPQTRQGFFHLFNWLRDHDWQYTMHHFCWIAFTFISSEEFKQITIAFNFWEFFYNSQMPSYCLARLDYIFISRKQISIAKITKTILIYWLLYYYCLKHAFHLQFSPNQSTEKKGVLVYPD